MQPDYPTPEEKRQTRVHKQYAKTKENEIREETLYYSQGKEKKWEFCPNLCFFEIWTFFYTFATNSPHRTLPKSFTLIEDWFNVHHMWNSHKTTHILRLEIAKTKKYRPNLRWVLKINFVRFWIYFRGQPTNEREESRACSSYSERGGGRRKPTYNLSSKIIPKSDKANL